MPDTKHKMQENDETRSLVFWVPTKMIPQLVDNKVLVR